MLGGLFDFLGDFLGNILSYINPFSENFFAYKLLELLGNLLRGLFVPESGFFENQFNTMFNTIKSKLPIAALTDIFDTVDDYSSVGASAVDFPNYSVGGLNIGLNNFIRFDFINQYKEVYFSWIRGFTYIGLAIFNINQIMKLFKGHGITDGGFREIDGQMNLFDNSSTKKH